MKTKNLEPNGYGLNKIEFVHRWGSFLINENNQCIVKDKVLKYTYLVRLIPKPKSKEGIFLEPIIITIEAS